HSRTVPGTLLQPRVRGARRSPRLRCPEEVSPVNRWRRRIALCWLGLTFLLVSSGLLWSDEPKAPDATAAKKEEEKKPPEPKPDPSGANTADTSAVGDKPPLKEVDEEKPELKDIASNQNVIYGYIGQVADAAN